MRRSDCLPVYPLSADCRRRRISMGRPRPPVRLRDCAVSNGVRNGSVALQNGNVEVIFNGGDEREINFHFLQQEMKSQALRSTAKIITRRRTRTYTKILGHKPGIKCSRILRSGDRFLDGCCDEIWRALGRKSAIFCEWAANLRVAKNLLAKFPCLVARQ